MKITLVVAAALVDTDGKVLLAQRPAHKPMGHMWEFPGGKVEKSETPEKALIRELNEELGINTWGSCLSPLTFVSHAYSDFHLLMPLYICRKWEGIVKPRENQLIKWLTPKQMLELPILPADIPVIAVLRDLL
jgi:8-oxo-dGTP diphosphatase